MESFPFAIVDCSKISGDYRAEFIKINDFRDFATKLGDGLSSGGGEMVYLINHDLPQELLDNIFLQSKTFFELEPEKKLKYKKVDPANNFHGYTPPTGEEIANESDRSVQDFKESYNFTSREICGQNYPNQEVPQLRPSILEFHSAMANFGKKLLALGLYMKLDDPEFFVSSHKGVNDLLNPEIQPWIDIRTNYYMPLDESTLASLAGNNVIRLGEHSDWGTITFLVQDQEGLEAKVMKKDGNVDWLPVPPIPGSILLNSGLFLEAWSAGRFPATPHRVKLMKGRSHEERQSLAWFMAPDGETRCEALVEKYKGWNWGHDYPSPNKDQSATDYFKDRIKGIFASQYK